MGFELKINGELKCCLLNLRGISGILELAYTICDRGSIIIILFWEKG
jgi:hypothetical protein